VVVLAGCAGGGGTPTATDVDGASDGGDGGGDGGSDSASDGGDGDPDATPPPTATATATPSPTPTPNASGTTTTAPLPRMSELLAFENSYRYSSEISTDEGTVRYEGRWYESDYASEVTFEGRTMTVYNVDGRAAYVADGDCFSQNVPSTRDPGNWTKESPLRNVTVRPSRTTTIDGETVYVYESDRGFGSVDGPITYYVSAETGYLRKLESADSTIEMYDWGHDESVELPC